MPLQDNSVWESLKYLMGAGGIVALLAAFMKYVQALGDRSRIVDEAHILRIENENKELRKNIETLTEQVLNQKILAGIALKKFNDYELPMWHKNERQELVWVNHSFRVFFPMEIERYIGKNDIDFHQNKYGEEYHKKSKEVWITGKMTTLIDAADDGNGGETFWIVQRRRIDIDGIPVRTEERVIMQVKDRKGNPL